jgi:hypothetical protein
MDYVLDEEKQKVRKELTPARRYSFLVGKPHHPMIFIGGGILRFWAQYLRYRSPVLNADSADR